MVSLLHVWGTVLLVLAFFFSLEQGDADVIGIDVDCNFESYIAPSQPT